MSNKLGESYPTFYVGIPILCALITCVVPWWAALIITVAITFFYDSVALVIVAWLISLEKPNPELLYVLEWLLGAVVTYCLIYFLKQRIGK